MPIAGFLQSLVAHMRRSDSDRPDLGRRWHLVGGTSALAQIGLAGIVPAVARSPGAGTNMIRLRGDARETKFDGIGFVNAGSNAPFLRDYPEPQRGQILDLLYKPKFGASVSALLVEIPGDGNSTQGSMPSHMHSRDDLNFHRGYIWWLMQQARKRNPALALDGTAWSAPGWIGERGDLFPRMEGQGDARFFSPDMIDYYLKWLEGLKRTYGLELDAIGVRNEKGVSYGFAKAFRKALNARGFGKVKLHAFDNWPDWKLDFVRDMVTDRELRDSIDIISAHVFYSNSAATPEVRAAAKAMGKPIWNTEDHVYKKGFDCAISVVQCFNHNYILSGATKVVNWYDVAALYPIQPYPEEPAAMLAYEPWSGHYRIREALWGYAHYGQFCEVGWSYLEGGCGKLGDGGSYVTLKAPGGEYSIIIETRDAKAEQELRVEVSGLSRKPLCMWRSNAAEQFVRQSDIRPSGGAFTVRLEPNTIYSLSTTTGQQKGGFPSIPGTRRFPFPYRETFGSYSSPRERGYLPRYTADIAGAFEIAERPDREGRCLRQVVAAPTISWAPDWQPYTIIGDSEWTDYEVSADIWLNPGDVGGVLGRINHVGTGYGFVPKGYFLELADGGRCRLVAIRGKKDPKALVGDAEQQALIRAGKFDGQGGELVLGETVLPGIGPNRWCKLMLRFKGETITGLVDGKPALSADNRLYARGMAGLFAGQSRARISTPWYSNLEVKPVGARARGTSR